MKAKVDRFSASVKTNLSGYFASSAARFSRKAYALEGLDPAAMTEAVGMEHRSYSIGAVISAASYLEAQEHVEAGEARI